MRWHIILLAVALAGCSLVSAVAGECTPGDRPCACAHAGGEWRELKAPLKPVCTFQFKQNSGGQGARGCWCRLGGQRGRLTQTAYGPVAAAARPAWRELAAGGHKQRRPALQAPGCHSNGVLVHAYAALLECALRVVCCAAAAPERSTTTRIPATAVHNTRCVHLLHMHIDTQPQHTYLACTHPTTHTHTHTRAHTHTHTHTLTTRDTQS
jgi:hypothetical protein